MARDLAPKGRADAPGQSDRVFDWRDEEPGRIPYQVRCGPLARLEMNLYSAHYADFASPLIKVVTSRLPDPSTAA